MFFIVCDDNFETLQKIEDYLNSRVLVFSDYLTLLRRKPESRDLFIAGDGRIITGVLEKLASDGAALNEVGGIYFDYDIIARLDEAVEIVPYFRRFLDSNIPIFYFLGNESTLARLGEGGIDTVRFYT